MEVSFSFFSNLLCVLPAAATRGRTANRHDTSSPFEGLTLEGGSESALKPTVSNFNNSAGIGFFPALLNDNLKENPHIGLCFF